MAIHNDSATEAICQLVIAGGATLNSLAVNVMTAPVAASTWTFTLRKNGVNTALSCTISTGATSCTSTGSVAFAAGDLLSGQVTNTGTRWTGGNVFSITARFN